jgi:hypothetical protein
MGPAERGGLGRGSYGEGGDLAQGRGNVPDDLLERAERVGPSSATRAESYLRGRLALHVHMCGTGLPFRRGRESDIREWCAVYRRPLRGRDPLDLGAEFLDVDRLRNEADSGNVDNGEAAVYDTVFVDVPEGVELLKSPRSVGSGVWLRPMEYCPSVVGYAAPEPVVGELGGIVQEGPGDGWGNVVAPEELDGIRATREQPSGLIQSRPEIMQQISDDHTQGERHGAGDSQEDHVSRFVRLELSGDVIRLRLEKDLAAALESFQVFASPVEFRPGSV